MYVVSGQAKPRSYLVPTVYGDTMLHKNIMLHKNYFFLNLSAACLLQSLLLCDVACL